MSRFPFHISFLLFLFPIFLFAQQTEQPNSVLVNVFLGSSGDYGQLSPAASYPFSQLSIGPQTYPSTHTGYEHLAKLFLGFTHNRFEGVGCQGSGGNLLVKPFLGSNPNSSSLYKKSEKASPGFYEVTFQNGISAAFTVKQHSGLHHYTFPKGKKGIFIDLSHAFNRAFVAEEHRIDGQSIVGWIDSRTTCQVGVYRLYYQLHFRNPVKWKKLNEHQLIVLPQDEDTRVELAVGFSSVDEDHAAQHISTLSFTELQQASTDKWDELFSRIKVNGSLARKQLFYSLLYRTLQSPYVISEPDGTYRTIDGHIQRAKDTRYHGWAIWDNYKTQLPLLALAYPTIFANVATSIANLYPYGKKDFATKKEPANSVRTEHAIVVLLDALNKGYSVPFSSIRDSVKAEVDRLDFNKPDKALESAYDTWAFAQLLRKNGEKELASQYLNKAATYKDYWKKDFEDLSKPDIDRMSARRMYQGTIRQYRWSIPFDVQGLIQLTGGKQSFTTQLDEFFDWNYYNRANEPDLMSPLLYNVSTTPWKAQEWIHKFAVDTTIHHYFNDNSRGIGSTIDILYKNQPQAYIRTMDDDAGAMSAWFVWAAIGVQPALIGEPVYYLHLPLFNEVNLTLSHGKSFRITVSDYQENDAYIAEAYLNGKKLNRNWLTHQEIMQGGVLQLKASAAPVPGWGMENPYVPALN